MTKLPNSEQSYKGKIKTHNYINRQNQSTTYTGKVYKQIKSVNNRKTVKNVLTRTWYRHFKRNGGLNQILKRTICSDLVKI
jgi:hypothetical protein